MNDTNVPMDFKIKYKRISRHQYGLSGSVELADLEGIESELMIYHQAKGSSKFVLTPYKLPRGSICESLNKDYRKFLMNDLKEFSNLPFSDDMREDICPQFVNVRLRLNSIRKCSLLM